MKVQLQTNYSTMNLKQKTNKSESFNNPNFKSTYQLSVPLAHDSLLAITRVEQSLEGLGLTSTLKVLDGLNRVDCLRISCSAGQDASVLGVIRQIVNDARDIYVQPIRAYQAKSQHSLTTADLKVTELAKPELEIFSA